MQKIVLDCDGVILDYNHTWGKILSKFLNKDVSPQKNAYHASNVFDYHLTSQEKKVFYKLFEEHGWQNMIPLDGALKALKILEKKFEIHIVTSIPQEANKLRHSNLKSLDIMFSSLHTVGFHKTINTKKEIVNHINPIYFVDDLLKNFIDINKEINCVLIDLPGEDNPNLDFLKNNPKNYSLSYQSLLDFALNI